MSDLKITQQSPDKLKILADANTKAASDQNAEVRHGETMSFVAFTFVGIFVTFMFVNTGQNIQSDTTLLLRIATIMFSGGFLFVIGAFYLGANYHAASQIRQIRHNLAKILSVDDICDLPLASRRIIAVKSISSLKETHYRFQSVVPSFLMAAGCAIMLGAYFAHGTRIFGATITAALIFIGAVGFGVFLILDAIKQTSLTVPSPSPKPPPPRPRTPTP